MKKLKVVTVLGIAFAFAVLAIPAALWLVPGDDYPSRAQCWRGDHALIIAHDLGNSIIWMQYATIPLMVIGLLWIERVWRQAQLFPRLAIEGITFVLLCGTTHLMSRVEIYQSAPWYSAVSVWLTVAAGVVFITDFALSWRQLRMWVRALKMATDIISRMEGRGGVG